MNEAQSFLLAMGFIILIGLIIMVLTYPGWEDEKYEGRQWVKWALVLFFFQLMFTWPWIFKFAEWNYNQALGKTPITGVEKP